MACLLHATPMLSMEFFLPWMMAAGSLSSELSGAIYENPAENVRAPRRWIKIQPRGQRKRRDYSMVCDWFDLQPESCSMKDSKHRIETRFRFWLQCLV